MNHAALANIGHNNPPAPVTDLEAVKALSPSSLFQDNGLDPLVAQIELEALADLPDISTPENIKAIKSRAHNVARLKTTIDDHGKAIVSEWKTKSKVVDQQRKTVWDKLEALQKTITKDVDAYEAKEKARKDGMQADLVAIRDAAQFHNEPTSEEVTARIESLRQYDGRDWMEFKEQIDFALTNTREKLCKKFAERVEYEQEKAELERLRKEKADKEEADRQAALTEAALTTPVPVVEVRTAQELQAAIKAPIPAPIAADPEVERRRAINQATLTAIENMKLMPKEDARTLLTAIIKGQIPNILIKY